MHKLRTTLRALLLATAAFSAGCAGSIRLFEDGKVHHGRYNQVSWEVEVTIDGELYAGTYVQGASAAFGLGFSGAQVSSFTGMSTDGSGQALLTSSSGKLLVCRFGSVVGYRGQGQCMTRDGRLFEMLIGEWIRSQETFELQEAKHLVSWQPGSTHEFASTKNTEWQ